MPGFITTHHALARLAESVLPATIEFLPHLPGAVGKFGAMEIEANAGGIVRFFQEGREQWGPFEIADLKAFYERTFYPIHALRLGIFYGLAGEWFDAGSMRTHEDPRFIRLLSEGTCMVTDRFILRCAGEHPDTISAITREAA